MTPGRSSVELVEVGMALKWTAKGDKTPVFVGTFNREQIHALRVFMNEHFKGDCPCTWNTGDGLKNVWNHQQGKFKCHER